MDVQYTPSDDPIVGLRSALLGSVSRISKLEAEVTAAQERLRRELMKVEKLRELISLYEVDEPPEDNRQPQLPDLATAGSTLRTVMGPPAQQLIGARLRSDTKKAQMIHAVDTLLALRGSVHRAEILKHLQGAGIMGHESNPMGHLAAFLSDQRMRFASDGKGNFSLKQPSLASEPLPASSDVGSVGVGDTAASSAHPLPERADEKGGTLYGPATQE